MVKLNNVEVDVSERCNLRCTQCSHNAPYFYKDDKFYTVEQFQADIEILKGLVHVTNFCLLGGEPLFNARLHEYAKILKEAKIADNVHVFTNGLLLNFASSELYKWVDRIFVSVYPLTPQQLATIKQNVIASRIYFPNVPVITNKVSHFLKGNSVEKNNDPELVQRIYNACYAAQTASFFDGRIYRCAISRKKYAYLRHHPLDTTADFKYLREPHDSIEITKQLTVEDVSSFLGQKTPLEACKWCLGCSGGVVEHKQLKQKSADVTTLKDLNFDEGKKYISNLIKGWTSADTSRNRKPEDDAFFDEEDAKEYYKYGYISPF